MKFTLSEGVDLTFALVLLGFPYNIIANKRLSIKAKNIIEMVSFQSVKNKSFSYCDFH